MKTTLPIAINSIEEAKSFLTELYNNGESFHPEDDAHSIDWSDGEMVTNGDCEQLNKIMEDIYNLPGNDGSHVKLSFDPCEFLLMLNPEYVERLNNNE